MSKIVYIGADGGGTKTALAASGFSPEEETLIWEGAGINYNFIGVKKAAKNFAEAIQKLSVPEETVIAGIAIGDPSVDDLTVSPMTDSFVSLVREYLSLPLTCPIHIKSDVYMTLYGLTEEAPGALMVSGTGAMGMAIDAGGALHVTGGWGRLTEDEGSGYFIAVNGIKAALRYYDETGPATILLKKMKDYFGMENPRDFILKYYANPQVFPEIAGFAKVVGDAAVSDKEALHILHRCGDTLAAGMRSLFRKAHLYDNCAGIYGSVLLHNELVRDRFERVLLQEYPKARVMVPSIRPEEAALKYIIKKERQK